MKTNYMNAKQQLLAITLTLATVISLAWVSPLKSEAMEKATIDATNCLLDEPVFETAQEIPEVTRKAATTIAIQDTTKKKSKIKIVTVDAKGNRKEYNSIKEMPDSLRNEVIKETFPTNAFVFGGDTLLIANKIKFSTSPEWKKQMEDVKKQAAEMRLKFDSPEWKKQVEDMKLNAEEMKKKFSSPEWKKQMDDVKKQAEEIKLKFDSPEWKKQMENIREQGEEMKKKFNSPEWKKQMEDIKKNASEMRLKFESPEWKKQIEDMKKLQELPEYKELRKKYNKEVEQLKKEKGIKSDFGTLMLRLEPLMAPMPVHPPAPLEIRGAINIGQNLKISTNGRIAGTGVTVVN